LYVLYIRHTATALTRWATFRFIISAGRSIRDVPDVLCIYKIEVFHSSDKITRSLICVSNATQTRSKFLLYFKVLLKSHLIATCFGLTRQLFTN
jgi:hypothetical protein